MELIAGAAENEFCAKLVTTRKYFISNLHLFAINCV